MLEFVIELIIYVVIVPIISIGAFWFVGRVGKRDLEKSANIDNHYFVVDINPLFSEISLFGGVLFIAILGFAYNPNNPTMIWGILLMGFFAVFFVFMAIFIRYSKIVVYMTEIKIYRMFRRTILVDMRDIAKVKEVIVEGGVLFHFYSADDVKLFTGNSRTRNIMVLLEKVTRNESVEYIS
jgi:hypothetical protein